MGSPVITVTTVTIVTGLPSNGNEGGNKIAPLILPAKTCDQEGY